MMISPYICGRLDEIDEAIKNHVPSPNVVKKPDDYVPSTSYPVWRAYINGTIHPDDAPTPTPAPEPAPVSAEDYRASCLEAWRDKNDTFKAVLSHFRRWKVNYNSAGGIISCTFQVRKDGANYENIPLPIYKNSLQTLRLFATIFNVPYRHNLKRKELLKILEPILYRLSYPPYPWGRRR
jgi:hypothetical protein